MYEEDPPHRREPLAGREVSFRGDNYVGRPWEPMDAWRTWAGRAHALLAVAAALQQKDLGAESDWRIATDMNIETPKAADRRLAPVGVLRRLLAQSGGRAAVAAGSGWRCAIDLGSDRGHSPLFGAIAVSSSSRLAGCRVCYLRCVPKRVRASTHPPLPGNDTVARPAALEKYLNDMRIRDIGRGKRKRAPTRDTSYVKPWNGARGTSAASATAGSRRRDQRRPVGLKCRPNCPAHDTATTRSKK